MERTTMISVVAVQLLFAAAAAVFPPVVHSGFYNPVVPQLYYVSATPMVAIPVIDPSRSTRSLPCPSQGFFPHPSNCSRFYRCVDYVGTGQFFSPYEFQCPAGQHFVAVGKNTCVPGDCKDGGAGGQIPSVAPQSDSVYPTGGEGVHIPLGDDPPPQGGSYPQPGQAGPPGGDIPPSPAQVGIIQPAPGGSNVFPQPGAGGVSEGSAGAGTDGAYPLPGAGTGSGVGGAYPQPGAGTGAGSGTDTGAGSGAGTGTGAGSGAGAGTGAGSGAGAGTGAGSGAGTGAGSGAGTGAGSGAGAGTGAGSGAGTGSGVGGAYPQPGAGTGSETAGSTTGPGAAGGTGTSPGSGAVPGVGGAYPQPGSGVGAPSTGSEAQTGTGGGYPGAQPGEECPARYVQHAQFCNVYEPCPEEGVQYICVTLNGQDLVFDQARQMCAFPSDKEDVCNGKPMMQSLFRTDVSLPDPSSSLHQLSVPIFLQGQVTPSLYHAPGIPYVYQQQQAFPAFSQKSAGPIFYQEQKVSSSQPNFKVETDGTAFISQPNSFISRPVLIGR